MKFAYSRFFFSILFAVSVFSCSDDNKVSDPDPDDNGISPAEFAMGVDLSYLNQIEDHGGIYLKNGVQVDPYEALKKHGANTVRLRLWHNPDWVYDLYSHEVPLYSGYEDVEKSIQRAKNAGMSVLLDFHYSDVWADPGHQDVPAAWHNITDIDVLADSVYNYTYNVLSKLMSKNLLPEMVQIGNETNCGMMMTGVPSGFPALNVCQGNWVNFGKIINAAISAVRDIDDLADQNTVVALHVADPRNLNWWLNDVINKGKVTDFEVMGFSFYHIWHTEVAYNAIPALISQLISTYKRDVMLLETAYPFTTANNDNYSNLYYNQPPLAGFPYTPQGQRDFMIDITQKMMDAGAIGVFYWEPTWITSDMIDLWGGGSSWENCAFFNYSGNLTNVVEYFTWEYD
ncbi:MAG: arabinogalactan endo-1 [Bacteroidetes bacterium]|nr:MAG: arabinogalactan endo-1 [Bacteroidota bacterium]